MKHQQGRHITLLYITRLIDPLKTGSLLAFASVCLFEQLTNILFILLESRYEELRQEGEIGKQHRDRETK
jgi:hypothetical protein